MPSGLHSQKSGSGARLIPFLLAHLVTCRSSSCTPGQGKAVLGTEPGSRNCHTAFKLLLVQCVIHHGKVFDAEGQKDVR